MILKFNVNSQEGIKTFVILFFVIAAALYWYKPDCITHIEEDGQRYLDNKLLFGYSFIFSISISFIVAITTSPKNAELSKENTVFSGGTMKYH